MSDDKPEKIIRRTFVEMVTPDAFGTLLPDHALASKSAYEEGFNLPLIMGPIFDVIRHPDTQTPLTIGVYGDWGTGKTSAMRWIQGLCEASNSLEKPTVKLTPAWFYPWKYQNQEDVWRGIISEVILATLDKPSFSEVLKKDLNDPIERKVVIDQVVRLVKSLGSMFSTAASAKFKAGDVEASVGIADLKKAFESFDKTYNPEKNYLNAFEDALQSWIKKSLDPNERLVVFIDDLDRCLPKITLQVLEALKLYLNIENLIFVVGVDHQVVRDIVIKHYADQGVGAKKAEMYLAKMFQLEVELGPSEKQIADYFTEQVENLEIWKSLSNDHGEILRSAIVKIAGRNPREIKRVANTALMGGVGAQWGSPKPNPLKFAQGVMIRLVQRELPYDLRDTVGNDNGDAFLKEVSKMRQDGTLPSKPYYLSDDQRTSLLKEGQRRTKQEEIEIAYLDKETSDNDPLSDLMKRREWRKYIPILEKEIILSLLAIPYPDDSSQFAIPVAIDETDPVLAALKGDSNPTRLELDGENVTDQSLISLRRLDRLEHLDLDNTQVTDAGLVHLKGLTSLQTLWLNNTQVTDAGMVHLKGLTSLQELWLNNTQITDAGMVHLKGLTNLQELWLGNTEITDEGLVHLKGLTRGAVNLKRRSRD